MFFLLWIRKKKIAAFCRSEILKGLFPLNWITLVWFLLLRRNSKTAFSLWKRIKCFPPMLRRRNLKMQQSPVFWDLCLRKTHMIIKVLFLKVFFFTLKRRKLSRRFQIPPVWRVGAFEKFRVRDGLVCMVGVTVEIGLRFQIAPA